MSYTWLQGIRKLVSDVFYTFFQRFAFIRKTEAKNGKKATVQQNKTLFPRKCFLPHKFISKIVDCVGKKHKLTFTNFQIKNIEIIEYKVYK